MKAHWKITSVFYIFLLLFLYFLADLESFIIELLIFKALKNNLPSALTSTLLTENIPSKDFKQKMIVRSNLFNISIININK